LKRVDTLGLSSEIFVSASNTTAYNLQGSVATSPKTV